MEQRFPGRISSSYWIRRPFHGARSPLFKSSPRLAELAALPFQAFFCGAQLALRFRLEKYAQHEWREVKRGLGWFSTLSANGSGDRLKEEGLTDMAHLGQEQFEFSVLSNGLLKEFSLTDPFSTRLFISYILREESGRGLGRIGLLLAGRSTRRCILGFIQIPQRLKDERPEVIGLRERLLGMPVLVSYGD